LRPSFSLLLLLLLLRKVLANENQRAQGVVDDMQEVTP